MEEDHDCQVIPRISFSDNLSEADRSSLESKRLDRNLPLNPTLSDFDFSVSLDSASAQDMRHADELFLDGKILSIPIQSSSPATTTVPALLKSNDSMKVYLARRSSSLSVSSSRNTTLMSAFTCPFLLSRSQSEASQTNLILKRRRKSNNNNHKHGSVVSHNLVRDVNAKRYDFSSSMKKSYVRSPPVTYRPKERNGARLASYFMCSCTYGG